MQMSVCEADQSDLAGQSALSLMVYEICSTCKLFQGLIQTLLLRGQYNSLAKALLFRNRL